LAADIFDPHDFFMRMHMRWIGRNIPRNDVRWIAQILAQLSPEQIRDAFRAGDIHPMKWKVSAKWWKVELPS